METTLPQQIDERLKAISDNEEKIRQLEKDNHWHKKYIRLLKQQLEEEKESDVSNSELLDQISKGLK